jgi:hypothetical protein
MTRREITADHRMDEETRTMTSARWTRRPSCAGGDGSGARPRPALACVAGCLGIIAGLGACHGSGARGTPPGEGAVGPTVPAEVAVVAFEGVTGLSGAATDARGVLWMVPERRHVLIEQGATPRAWPLSGVPDEGLDLESLAWLGTNDGRERFAVGTEGVCERNTHAVLVVEREGEGFRVTETIRLPLDLWPETVCEDGHGLEGLCAAMGPQGEVHLVAAIEHPERDAEKRRFAPLGVRGPDGRWIAQRVALTSETGKISAMDCRLVDQGIEVWAIERHFETSRLVRFVVPRDGALPAGLITPVVALDLMPQTDDGRRNFEGLTVTGDRVQVLVDNQWRTITGPNEILSLTLPAQP